MDDHHLLRYARHILLPQLGIDGQERLRNGRVLIVGLGGLGTPAALYLATSGVGTLLLADGDTVDLSNLPRQVLYHAHQVGVPKTEAAAATLSRITPDLQIETIGHHLDPPALFRAVRTAHVVVDACDNFATRFAINQACAEARVPVVSAAVIRFEGQISVFRHDLVDAPCYRCLYPDLTADEDDSCVRNGVLAPVAGVMGTMQALETIKILTGAGTTLAGRLLLFDGLMSEWREVRLRRDPGCPVCGAHPAASG